ncbi:MAG: carbonic anhydrase [Deltaproteobacteria bacterium]|nr:carbonic anhydrase [Deltaproteobacteria bacterium]
MTETPDGRVDIVPRGASHFEVRCFENHQDTPYRSWCLPLTAAQTIARWWLSRSLPLEEVPTGGDGRLEMEAEPAGSVSLMEVEGKANILARYQETPIADWLRYHNLGEGRHTYDSPKMLIVTCMDYRIQLRVPKNFAYVLRLAGANVRYREFDLACALAFAGVRHVCVVGHTGCAMESLIDKREDFASGLERAGGWNRTRAELEFNLSASRLNLSSVLDFTQFESGWLERRFPGILVAPLIYDVKGGALHQIVSQR